MANAVFNSEQSYFNNNQIKANFPRTPFDLSWIHTFDMDFGVLVPFYLEETLPSDDFSIECIIKATSLPLKAPIVSNIKIRTAFFYVPYYLLWHKFDKFLSGGRDGTLSFPLPKFDTDLTVTSRSLGHYMGFPIGCRLSDVSPFPFFAYQRIYRDYYLDQDNQTSGNTNIWFPMDDFDFSLDDTSYLSLDEDGSYSTEFACNAIRPANWRKDYFTSSMFSPQRGDPVAMPVTGEANVRFDDVLKQNFYPDAVQANPYIEYNHDGLANMAFGTSTNHHQYDVEALESLNKAKAYFGSNSVGFTIDDLRFAEQLQIWLERNMRAGSVRYGDFLRAHFNDAPRDERLTKPLFIGGTSQSFSVSEILQTSESTASSAQGTARGHGSSFDSQFVGRVHSHEYGLILGLISIMPDTTYSQGLDRHWTKESRYDFFFPEFTDIGPQAILNKELYYEAGSMNNDKVFGYVGRNDEYRHHRNLVSGSLADPSTEDFYSWSMAREFSSLPTLNSFAFTSGLSTPYVLNLPTENSTIRHDAWETGTTVCPFIIQAGFKVRAVRPLPYVNVPKGLV